MFLYLRSVLGKFWWKNLVKIGVFQNTMPWEHFSKYHAFQNFWSQKGLGTHGISCHACPSQKFLIFSRKIERISYAHYILKNIAFSPNFSIKIVPKHFKDKNLLRIWHFEQRWFSPNLFLWKLFQNISNLRFFSEQYLLDKKSFKNIAFWKTVMFSQFF